MERYRQLFTSPYSPKISRSNIPRMDFNALNEDVRALREDILARLESIEKSGVVPAAITVNPHSSTAYGKGIDRLLAMFL